MREAEDMFRRYELHNHTTESDAGITCRQLTEHMAADGVDVFAVTDHNTVSGHPIIRKLLNPAIPLGYSSTMAALLFSTGMIMFMLGLIGEYIGRIYISLNNSPQFVIRDTINLDE